RGRNRRVVLVRVPCTRRESPEFRRERSDRDRAARGCRRPRRFAPPAPRSRRPEPRRLQRLAARRRRRRLGDPRLRDLWASASVAWFDAVKRPGDQKSRGRASLISFAALCLLSKRMSDEKPRRPRPPVKGGERPMRRRTGDALAPTHGRDEPNKTPRENQP